MKLNRLIFTMFFIPLIIFVGSAKAYSEDDLNRLLETNECKGCDLRNAPLYDLNLSGTDLRNAKLNNADLRGADLKKANLKGADVRGARFDGAQFNKDTVLPNGQHWSEVPPKQK